ncbi:MAG: arginine decarboxylase [Micromonosporaceae bacterium]
MNSDLLSDAPLLAAWLSYTSRGVTPFTIPGHKGAAGRLWPALGSVLAGDVPLFGGLDSVKLSAGVLRDAEGRAARLWGGDWCRFSTGGSTHANQALAMAVAPPGSQVLVSRCAHRSTLLGLVMAGLAPVWLPPTVDGRFGVPREVPDTALRAALARHPAARAVFLVEPSYLGTVSDLPALVASAHAAGLPVVVDQAWGGHFGFHPALPGHALARGADALVTSAHKTLPAYSQASLIVARTERLDPHRLDRAFDAGNTTSPAGAILASIDGARALLSARGAELLDPLIAMVARARERLRAVPGVLVPGPEDFPAGRFDPAKLVVVVAGSGASGIDVERDLLHADVPVEMADQDTVVPVVTLADTGTTVERLVEVLCAAILRHSGAPRPLAIAPQWTVGAAAAMAPRDAFFADHETVPSAAAVGRICAEVVAPYPPGVPVLVPGEVVTADVLGALRALREAGTRIAYAADPGLDTLQVVAG